MHINQKGFTLLEIILSVAVISLLVGSVSLFFTALQKTQVKNQVVLEVEEQGAHTLQEILSTIKNASSIISPQNGESGSSLSLTVPDSTKSPTLFTISDAILQIQEGAILPIALTNSRARISNLLFQNLSAPNTPGIIRISFSLSYANPDNIPDYDYTKIFIGSASLR